MIYSTKLVSGPFLESLYIIYIYIIYHQNASSSALVSVRMACISTCISLSNQHHWSTIPFSPHLESKVALQDQTWQKHRSDLNRFDECPGVATRKCFERKRFPPVFVQILKITSTDVPCIQVLFSQEHRSIVALVATKKFTIWKAPNTNNFVLKGPSRLDTTAIHAKYVLRVGCKNS